jgi:hypothetical protein
MTGTLTGILETGGHPISYQAKSIHCSACGKTLAFSTEDRGFLLFFRQDSYRDLSKEYQ